MILTKDLKKRLSNDVFNLYEKKTRLNSLTETSGRF